MNRDFGDLNKLISWARAGGFSVTVEYYEGSDKMSIAVFSNAYSECFYQKRVVNIDHFIECWDDHVRGSKYKIGQTVFWNNDPNITGLIIFKSKDGQFLVEWSDGKEVFHSSESLDRRVTILNET